MNLQEFSARKFGPEKIPDPFSEHFPKSRPGPSEMSEMVQKSISKTVKYGLFWFPIDPFGLGFGPYGSKLVWKPIGPHLDPIWVTYGPVLAHFHVFGLLLDYCWPFPYCSLFPLVALFPCLGSPLRYAFPLHLFPPSGLPFPRDLDPPPKAQATSGAGSTHKAIGQQ